jgi:Tfp pilus assembly protein PilO
MIKNLSKEKRNQLILVWLMTLAVVCTWAFVFLSWQLDARHQSNQNLEKLRAQFESMTTALGRADETEEQMGQAEQTLAAIESQMAIGGDTYSWVINTMRDFKARHTGVELPQFSQISISEVSLLPKFPYRQASVTVAGAAHFDDLGQFLADFENRFHFARIINLEIEAGSAGNSSDREKLRFKMDIIFLMKSNAS